MISPPAVMQLHKTGNGYKNIQKDEYRKKKKIETSKSLRKRELEM